MVPWDRRAISTVVSQQDGRRFNFRIFFVLEWDSYKYSGFLSQTKNVYVRLTDTSKLSPCVGWRVDDYFSWKDGWFVNLPQRPLAPNCHRFLNKFEMLTGGSACFKHNGSCRVYLKVLLSWVRSVFCREFCVLFLIFTLTQQFGWFRDQSAQS